MTSLYRFGDTSLDFATGWLPTLGTVQKGEETKVVGPVKLLCPIRTGLMACLDLGRV